MAIKNLLGQKFGRLTVLERDLTKKGGAAYWICKCDCDTVKSIRGGNLTTSTKPTRSCGCLNKEKNKNNIDTSSQVGKRYGRLIVLERDLTKPIGHSFSSYWICQCDCGNIVSVALSQLSSKQTQSCGCLRTEQLTLRNTKDISEQRFGMVIAKENTGQKNSHGSYIWRCECDCGNTNYFCPAESLLSGRIFSCGCSHKSKGETIIENILLTNNIQYIKQQTFNDLKGHNNQFLKYDFAILENNTIIRLIEFDGEQHYNPKSQWYTQRGLELDQLKNQYAKEKNIPLIRIPYTEINNLSLDLLMSDKYLI